MSDLRLKVSKALTVPFLAACITLVALAATVARQRPPVFNVHQKAAYLDPAAIDFVRPGLKLQIVSASIDSGGTIQTRLKVTDPRGLPLDRTGVVTPGAVSLSFIAAVIPNGATQYTAYTTRVQTSPITKQTATQAGTDAGGTYQQVGDGEYTYTFNTKASQGYDRSATHSIGIYSSRNLTEFNLGTQYANAVFNFVPDGSAVKNVRDVARTENCNRCHDPLSAHGGARQQVELCVLCHTPQTTDPDTGNTVDFKVMIHKIHRGSQLPSVKAGKPYQIIGFNPIPNDYSTVVFPAGAAGNGDTRRCEICHEPRPGGTPAAVATQKNNYLTKPNRAACGACHDDVNFATGQNHAGGVVGPQLSDNLCGTCHIPQGEEDFDASIKGAHVTPTHSLLLPSTIFDILKVDSSGPGQKPTVTFSIKDRNGVPILPSDMARVALVTTLSSTTDYGSYVSEDASKATGSNGVYTYTFQTAIPADARGTFAVGIEGYRNVTLLQGTTKEMKNVRDAGVNKVFYYGVTDPKPVPRRAVVSQDTCETCHVSLELHGSNRNQVEHCLICHNPNENDSAFRPAAQNPVESVHFKTMIHKIHRGENLTTDFTIFGFGGSKNNFNDVRFPGDLRDCQQCHLTNTEQVPPPDGALPSQQPRGWFSPQQPTTAACLACHTEKSAAAHALINTSLQLGESCDVCHGTTADFSIDKVHAR